MSWLAVKYAFSNRDPRIKGSVRLTLIALAARVEYRHITTAPTSLGDLRWLTLLSAEQLRRIIDDLERWGEVRRLSRGKNAVYGLPKMAGPLFVVDDDEKPVNMTDFIIEKLPPKTGQDARKVTGRMTDFSGRRAGGVLFSEVHRTVVPTTSREEEAEGFLAWFCEEFRARRHHRYAVKRPAALAVIRAMLADRSVDRLQAMAVLMFEAERDQFIVTSDYGLWVLEHKQTYLEGLAIENERRAARQEAVS